VAKRLTAAPAPATSVRSDLPPQVDGVLARALALQAPDRYASAGEFAAHLQNAIGSAGSNTLRSPTARPRARLYIAAGIAGAALAARAWWIAQLGDTGPSGRNVASTDRKMIAVLPFRNLGAPEDDYVATGVTEEVTSRLASLGLGVISRTSTDQYKGSKKSLKEIARELGVDYVLEGGVRRAKLPNPQASDRVLVTPQLVRVSNDSAIWADRIDENAGDLFAVQARIAERVAAALDVTLGASERATLTRAPTTNFAAYNEYLRGLAAESQQNRESVLEAVRLYEEATRLDSTFALAYVRLAEAHLSLYGMFGDMTEQRLTQFRHAIDTALRLDPDLPEARMALAMFYIFPTSDYERAETELARVEPRRRNTSDGWSTQSSLDAFRGRWTEARSSAERAVELDPRSPKAIWNAVVIFTTTRDYSHTKRYLERLRVVAPEDVSVYVYEAYVDATLGESLETARSLFREAVRRYGLARVVGVFTLTPTVPFDLLGLLEPSQLAAIDSLGLSVRDFGGDSAAFYFVIASLHRRRGRANAARVYYDSLRLFATPKLAGPAPSMLPRGFAAFAYAGLGRKTDALREAQTMANLRPPSQYPAEGVLLLMLLARIEALVGEKEAAINHLEYLLSVPSAVSVPALRVESTWDSLRDQPRFQRLLEQRR
jgi:TolB-like protein/Tfp pilus assembly protein PilF